MIVIVIMMFVMLCCHYDYIYNTDDVDDDGDDDGDLSCHALQRWHIACLSVISDETLFIASSVDDFVHSIRF